MCTASWRTPLTCKLGASRNFFGFVLLEHGPCCTAGSTTDPLESWAALVLQVLFWPSCIEQNTINISCGFRPRYCHPVYRTGLMPGACSLGKGAISFDYRGSHLAPVDLLQSTVSGFRSSAVAFLGVLCLLSVVAQLPHGAFWSAPFSSHGHRLQLSVHIMDAWCNCCTAQWVLNPAFGGKKHIKKPSSSNVLVVFGPSVALQYHFTMLGCQ